MKEVKLENSGASSMVARRYSENNSLLQVVQVLTSGCQCDVHGEKTNDGNKETWSSI